MTISMYISLSTGIAESPPPMSTYVVIDLGTHDYVFSSKVYLLSCKVPKKVSASRTQLSSSLSISYPQIEVVGFANADSSFRPATHRTVVMIRT